MRVSFSSEVTARAARSVLEAYGYSAVQLGRELVTDCPTLLAVPAIKRSVGFAAIEHLDLTGRELGTGAHAHAAGAPAGTPVPQFTA